MKLLEPTALSDLCDYSFGDQSGMINNIPGAWMKEANDQNVEFIDKYSEVKNAGKNIMTLFIDNIRLYNRECENLKDSDRDYVNNLMSKNDLLKLCSNLKDMNFIIFTGLEDTPIDKHIFDKIPANVLGIYASNAITFGDKVHPIPYGLQRRMNSGDNRLDVMQEEIKFSVTPTNLLYVNHTISNNPGERGGLNDLFAGKSWVTVNASKIDYKSYLENIRNHKFMICPHGNAIDCDCHRNWEVLYMRRVPVMKRCKYLEYIFRDFPVLFVNEYSDVTEELLTQNENLYQEACMMNREGEMDLDILFNEILKIHQN